MSIPQTHQHHQEPVRRHGLLHDLAATLRMRWDAHIRTSRVWEQIKDEIAERDRKQPWQ